MTDRIRFAADDEPCCMATLGRKPRREFCERPVDHKGKHMIAPREPNPYREPVTGYINPFRGIGA